MIHRRKLQSNLGSLSHLPIVCRSLAVYLVLFLSLVNKFLYSQLCLLLIVWLRCQKLGTLTHHRDPQSLWFFFSLKVKDERFGLTGEYSTHSTTTETQVSGNSVLNTLQGEGRSSPYIQSETHGSISQWHDESARLSRPWQLAYPSAFPLPDLTMCACSAWKMSNGVFQYLSSGTDRPWAFNQVQRARWTTCPM